MPLRPRAHVPVSGSTRGRRASSPRALLSESACIPAFLSMRNSFRAAVHLSVKAVVRRGYPGGSGQRAAPHKIVLGAAFHEQPAGEYDSSACPEMKWSAAPPGLARVPPDFTLRVQSTRVMRIEYKPQPVLL